MAVLPLLTEQMRAALNAHDVDAFIDLFHEDYSGERPRHPGSRKIDREEVPGRPGRLVAHVSGAR
jgi:hypothetical protein